jgi:hypothetical protein
LPVPEKACSGRHLWHASARGIAWCGEFCEGVRLRPERLASIRRQLGSRKEREGQVPQLAMNAFHGVSGKVPSEQVAPACHPLR